MKTYIVDSFTDVAFKGNPAGVCLLDKPLSEDLMLSIAQELNLSETAFVKENQQGYDIRYFSPKMEIPLCGHATLAASKVLFANRDIDEIHFNTIESIDLEIHRMGDEIQMEFPVYDLMDAEVPLTLLNALGLDGYEEAKFNKETQILMLRIDDANVLSELNPDFVKLEASHDGINGVLITATSTKENFDFESRYFWPWSGTNEDPVTGGTHTFLAKYWSGLLGKTTLNSFQSSSRTGFMQVSMTDNNTVIIKSKAIIVFEGRLKD